MAPTIVIIGPSRSGRTSIGRSLATLLNTSFRENEELLSSSVERLFLENPHEAKREAIAAGLSLLGSDGGVVTLMPSAASAPEIVDALRTSGVAVIELTCTISELARRANLNAPRSAALGTPRALFAAQVRQFHESVASLDAITCDTSGRPPDEVAEQIARQFRLE